MSAPDVVVAGSGPAGAAAAAACARAGLRTLLVAPAPERVWPQTYALWWDELVAGCAGLGLPPAAELATRYDGPLVRTASRGERALPRAYAVVRNAALHAALAAVPGVERRRGRLGDPDLRPLLRRAGLVVDATGRHDPGRAQQRAVGEVVTGAGRLVPPGSALFMDWVAPAAAGLPADTALFAYGMDLGGGRALVELTSLAAAPPVPLPVLRAGLDRLLAAAGAAGGGAVERVAIPLGPVRGRGGTDADAAVPFGAAAGLVHPATGYSVATSLRLAPALATAAAAALGAGRPAAPAVRAAVLPPRRRATAALLGRGLDVLLPLDQAGCDAFFGAFLDLPEPVWAAYLDVLSPPAAVAGAMGRALAALPWRLRAHTLRRTALPR